MQDQATQNKLENASVRTTTRLSVAVHAASISTRGSIKGGKCERKKTCCI
jgi:hypothetical protein